MSCRWVVPFLLALACGSCPAFARNIVISNDDGLTANVKALYDALKAKGHDVIVAVPCPQQSGMGGAIKVFEPLPPLSADCVGKAGRVGDPGAGPMTREGFARDFYYVDGTPVMALLYGIDIAAQARWGKPPELVLSGPNVGQNPGAIVVSSGTVSVAQYAMMRGIPAIALSAGEYTASGDDLLNPLSAIVAKRSLELVDRLEAASHGGPLLPPRSGLNVNFPDEPAAARWKLTRIGTYSKYELFFVPDLPTAMGEEKSDQPARPGLFGRLSDQPPAAGEMDDESVVAIKDISVSLMQVGYEAPAQQQDALAHLLCGLAN